MEHCIIIMYIIANVLPYDMWRHIFNPHVLFGRSQGLFNGLKNGLNIQVLGWYFLTFPILWELILNTISTCASKIPLWKMLHHFCFGLTGPRYKTWLNVMDFHMLFSEIVHIQPVDFFLTRMIGINSSHISNKCMTSLLNRWLKL